MAAKGPNAAREIEEEEDQESGRFNQAQLKAVSNKEKDGATTLAEDKEFKGIYMEARKQLSKNGTSLSEQERKAFQERLLIANEERDPKKLATIQKHIDDTIKETQTLTKGYFEGLERNKDLFGKDASRNVDTLKEYKDDFAKQDVAKKKEWANKLTDEVKSLQDLRTQLIKTVGEGKESEAYMDKFNKLRRHEKKDYLKEIKEGVQEFTKTIEALKKSGLYSDEEIKNLSVKYREAPLDKQKKILAELQEDAKSDTIKAVQDTFKKFSPEMQKAHEAALKRARGLKAKKEVIEQMKENLRDKLIQLWQNSKYQSPKEKAFLVASIEKEQKPEMLEMFVKSFPQVENTLKGFAKAYEKTPPNVQAQYDFWNADYSEKEKIAKECDKHMELGGKWNEKIDKLVNNAEGAVKKPLIATISAGKYKTGFEKLSIKDKEATLKSSTLDDPRRKIVVDRFGKLPKEVQEKNKQFYNMRLRDRMELTGRLEGGINKKAELTKDYEKKLADLVEQRLLSPLSVEEKMNEFAKLDDEKKMKSELDKSDLDSPGRRKVLETFEDLPEATRKPHEVKFYNQDQTDRIETLKTLLPDGGTELAGSLAGMEAAKELTDKLETETELKAYRDMANEFRVKNNQKAEMELRQKIADLDSEDKANLERLEELKMLENPDSQFIGDLLTHVKAEAGMKEEIQANHIMFEIADRAHAHELHSKKQGMEARTAANDNSEMGELSQELFDYSDGEQMLDQRTGRAIDMQIFDENDLFRNKNVVKINEHRKRFKKDGQTFTDSPARLGQYGLRDHSGKELKGEELMQYKRKKATLLAAKILSMGTDGQVTGTPSNEVVNEMLRAIDEMDDFQDAA